MHVVALTQKKSLELKKHVGLIHSANKLGLLGRKIANALLYHAYENLLTKNEHEIYLPNLCQLIGYNSNDHKAIKRALVSLMSTVLEWNLMDQSESGNNNIWMASTMLADAKIKGTICTYSYSYRMRELYYYPELYARLNMRILATFKSTYGLALYENCIRYQNIAQTPWFDILTYRKLMGVAQGKYVVFRDLNRRVIKPAVREVNEYTKICIKPEFKKEKGVVTAIRFRISKQAEKTQLDSVQNVKPFFKERSIEERLREDYGLSAVQLKIVIEQYDESYLLEKMSLIESSNSYQEGKINHLAKYFEKALIEDYQPPKSSKGNLDKLRAKHEEEAKVKAKFEERRKRYRAYQTDYLPEVYEKLPEKEKLKILRGFDRYIAKTLYHSVYAKDGLNNPLVRDRLADFIRAYHSELLSSLLSFEVFCNQMDCKDGR